MLAACGRFGFEGEPPLSAPTHVPGTVTLGGTGTLVLDASVLDTTALTIDGAPPAYGQLVAVAQLGGGPELALLQADRIVVDGTLDVVGNRGLVILARTIDVSGVIDASGGPGRPGPGAVATTANAGVHLAGDVCDSGGGGGGHASVGAVGGDVPSCIARSAGGTVIGDPNITMLLGGGTGGAGVSGGCGVPGGGGGGGALQLSAADALVISGTVLAGGGGGSGGPECGDGDAGGGAGGGAGGAIFLEAPSIAIDGVLIANGGGGGGGGNGLIGNGPVGRGGEGESGIQISPARGGIPPAQNAGAGGTGGTEDTLPGTGKSGSNNAGGGGGAVGRVVIVGGDVAISGVVSPRGP